VAKTLNRFSVESVGAAAAVHRRRRHNEIAPRSRIRCAEPVRSRHRMDGTMASDCRLTPTHAIVVAGRRRQLQQRWLHYFPLTRCRIESRPVGYRFYYRVAVILRRVHSIYRRSSVEPTDSRRRRARRRWCTGSADIDAAGGCQTVEDSSEQARSYIKTRGAVAPPRWMLCPPP